MIGTPNAEIKVVAMEATNYDPYTGEPVFAVASVSTVSAVLEETSPPKELNLSGVDNPIAYLEGRISGTPTINLKEGNFYGITTTLQNQIKTCRFYVVASPSSRMGLDSFFGQFIAGFLTE